jgi:recombination protein RecA
LSKIEKDLDPKSGDEALQILLEAVLSKAFSVVVLDSIAILEPKEEQGVDIEQAKNKMGLQGKMMSTALRKLVQAAFETDTCVIFINQLRDKLDPYGPREETPGGRAVKFASSVRINVHPVSGKENKYMSNGELIGHKIAMQTVKSRLAPPMRVAEIDLYYSAPLDTMGEVMALALEFDIISLAGRTYSYKGNKLGTSAAELKAKFTSDFAFRQEITTEVERIIDGVVQKERAAEKIDLDKPVVAEEEVPENVMELGPEKTSQDL